MSHDMTFPAARVRAIIVDIRDCTRVLSLILMHFWGWRPDVEHELRLGTRYIVLAWEESGRETKHVQAWCLLRSEVFTAVL